jgi:hypothetical protein
MHRFQLGEHGNHETDLLVYLPFSRPLGFQNLLFFFTSEARLSSLQAARIYYIQIKVEPLKLLKVFAW